MSRALALLRTTRPPFLVLTPVCVVLGAAAAVTDGDQVAIGTFSLVMSGAVCAHIAVNMLNEYQDFRSGLDATTRRTPFSGGSGALIEEPAAAPATLASAVVAMLLAAGIGLWLARQHGPGVLPLGIAGGALILLYTTVINRFAVACLLAPGLGFGPLMVMGTAYVLQSRYSLTAAMLSLIPMLLANNLLLLNQFPDAEPDRAAGRRHVPAQYGYKVAGLLHGVQVIATAMVLAAIIRQDIAPPAAAVAFFPLAGALVVSRAAVRYRAGSPGFLPYMAANVAAALLTPAIIAAAILLREISL